MREETYLRTRQGYIRGIECLFSLTALAWQENIMEEKMKKKYVANRKQSEKQEEYVVPVMVNKPKEQKPFVVKVIMEKPKKAKDIVVPITVHKR